MCSWPTLVREVSQGVRVGIVLAKALAWAQGSSCAGATAFDLVAPSQTVALPSRKGEYFLRVPGQEPIRTSELPAETRGYGFGGSIDFPLASGAAKLAGTMQGVEPTALMPIYLAEPSISTPKRPLSRVAVD